MKDEIQIPAKLTTAQLSKGLKRSSGTIRNALHEKGSFWGVTPIKSPSGGLYWPSEPFLPFLDIESLEGNK